jgi:hypothetical protein
VWKIGMIFLKCNTDQVSIFEALENVSSCTQMVLDRSTLYNVSGISMKAAAIE